MPPRSVKMKRRIFGFQRRVWWPKWTPASKSSRIETTDIGIRSPFWLVFGYCRRGLAGTGIRRTPAPPPRSIHRIGYGKPLQSSVPRRCAEGLTPVALSAKVGLGNEGADESAGESDG